MSKDKFIGDFTPRTVNFIMFVKELECGISDCTNQVSDWHHITSVRKQKCKKDAKAMKILSVEWQIPVCVRHYIVIYTGKYDYLALRRITGYSAARDNIKKLLKIHELNKDDN